MTRNAVGPRRGDWTQCRSGRRFYVLDARPEEVDVQDIAHALANLCRFTGHTSSFWSVAQHSVLVSRHVPARLALAALFHDAAEAYLADVARPVKRHLYFDLKKGIASYGYDGMRSFAQVEADVLVVIFEAIGIPWPDGPDWDVIAHADNRVCATEARDLLQPLDVEWMDTLPVGTAPLSEAITDCWLPRQAKTEFWQRWQELKHGDGGGDPPLQMLARDQ